MNDGDLFQIGLEPCEVRTCQRWSDNMIKVAKQDD